MAQIPTFLLSVVRDVPDKKFEAVLVKLGVTEKDVFKKYACGRVVSDTFYGDFVLSLFSCERATVAALYKSIEGVLFFFFFAPGLGIAFNLVDACFCFILGNWLGCFVAIVSCFPIPGFKLAGKGAEKFILVLINRISPTQLSSFVKKLGERLSKIDFHSGDSYIAIRKQIESLITELHNPFAEGIINELSKIIKRFPTSHDVVSNSVNKSGKELFQSHSVQSKLLEITLKSSHL